jgi:hypothetical protein
MGSDTLIIPIGYPVMIFADSTNDPTQYWTITASPSTPKWEATTLTYHSAPTSFTDSKTGNYANNATVTMTLTNSLDLTGYNIPTLTYWTKFDIEGNYDYGQVEVSLNNGTTWIPLKGKYTNPGIGASQPDLEPLYDGTISDWVKEEISLTNYKSGQFKVRFQLKSDGNERRDGWYVDDIGIFIYTIPTDISGNADPVYTFSLDQNYPNPFNPTSTINYRLIKPSKVQLTVYNALGQKVKVLVDNVSQKAGSYQVQWNGQDQQGRSVASGIYLYQLTADNQTIAKKMLLLK